MFPFMATTLAPEFLGPSAAFRCVAVRDDHIPAPAFIALAIGLIGSGGFLVTHYGELVYVVDFPFACDSHVSAKRSQHFVNVNG